ncbi:MAG: 30S ribosomal protein S3 [Patescibacteria group bacterium]
MGQKINPRGFRIGPVFNWSSRWYADSRTYSTLLLADVALRRELGLKLKSAGLALVEIERSINKVKVTVHVSRPGVVIGRGGSGLEILKKLIEGILSKRLKVGQGVKVDIAVEPVKEPNLNATLVANTIADQLVRRMPHKRVCNQAVERAISSGAKGVRIRLSGRINGAEIARREKFQSGTIPLSTIREDIDFAIAPALTKSGYIGVKVWICRRS